MKLSAALTSRLWNALFARVAMRRPADFVIGAHSDPYLLRWYLLGAKRPIAGDNYPKSRSILRLAYPYLHCFMRSDDPRALHDHPAPSVSLILAGSCLEVTVDGRGLERRRKLSAGMIVFRSADFAHRIEIEPGVPCWTLFTFGPRIREWGFHTKAGWVHWKDFPDA